MPERSLCQKTAARSVLIQLAATAVCSIIDGNETGMRVGSLSQEHGDDRARDDAIFDRFKVGDRVRILANHSCLTAAQHSHYNVLENGEIVDRWEIHTGW